MFYLLVPAQEPAVVAVGKEIRLAAQRLQGTQDTADVLIVFADSSKRRESLPLGETLHEDRTGLKIDVTAMLRPKKKAGGRSGKPQLCLCIWTDPQISIEKIKE